MRTYNEQSLGEAVKGLTGNSREEREQFKKVRVELIRIQCATCKKENLVKHVKLVKYYKNKDKNKDYTCYGCSVEKKAQDKKEMNEALINLARSKGLIK